MNVRQAAERLECSISTVYALVTTGKLKCNRIGVRRGVIRISEQQVMDYLGAGTIIPAAPALAMPPLKHLKV